MEKIFNKPGAMAIVVSCLACRAVVAAGSSQPPSLYTVTQTVSVGSPDRWDYLTLAPDSRRLYLAHGDRVDVLDATMGKVLGRVVGTAGGSHGIGIVEALNKGYTDDGKAGEVLVFDLQTLKVTKRLKAEPDADGIAVDPKSSQVFVIDGDSGDVTVIDATTDRVVGSIKIGGALEFAVADGTGKVYVNGAQRRALIRVDALTRTVDARWPIPDCENPHGLAMDVKARRLFVSCVNQLMVVVDADSGHVVATLPIGRGTDAAAFDPVRKRVFSSNGVDGTVSVLRQNAPDSYTPLATIRTAVTGRTMAIDPDTGRLYVAAAAIDPSAPPPPPRPDGRPGRPQPLPGSLKVLYLDPNDAQ
jgi:YVTN family beta-propeller protein